MFSQTFKGPLLGLRQFLATESPLKTIKKRFLFHLFIALEKRFDKKTKVNFKIYDVANWETNSYDTHITQYLKK